MVGLVLLLLFTFFMTHLSFRWFYRCFHDALVQTITNVNDVNDSYLSSLTSTVVSFGAIGVVVVTITINVKFQVLWFF